MFFEWLESVFIRVFEKDVQSATAFFFLSGIVHLAIVFFIVVLVYRRRKKRRKKVPERQIEFALPDRENTYIRARLATVLNEDAIRDDQKEELPITFSHAKTLLDKVRFSPLSQAERLEMDALEKTMETYAQCTQFSGKDVRVINDTFLRLLKLSAKYGV